MERFAPCDGDGHKTPAAAVGLHDRGVIAQGLRADLVRFRLRSGDVMVQSVWAQGRQVS